MNVAADWRGYHREGAQTHALEFRKYIFRDTVLIEIGFNVRDHVVDDSAIDCGLDARIVTLAVFLRERRWWLTTILFDIPNRR